MFEIKLIKTTLRGKTVLAQIMGARLIAEPDAKYGIHWEKDDDIFAIIHKDDVDDFNEYIQLFNKTSFSGKKTLEDQVRLVYKGLLYKTPTKMKEIISNTITNS
jgi:hypothetical protein